MPELRYHLVDVFTDQQFGGNPLAVFMDSPDLPTDLMQTLAREFNYSEITFIQPADDPANHCRVRIFTPTYEMPMAGHPTIGTAYVLAKNGWAAHHGRAVLRFEEQVGLIPVMLDMDNGEPGMIWMQQPLPTFGSRVEDRALMAETLSLSPDDLDADLPIEVVSTGAAFLFAPLVSLDAIARVRLQADLWDEHFRALAHGMFIFTRDTVHPTSTVHSRMFSPERGIVEDPATGSASGGLGAYLVQYGVAAAHTRLISEQGLEMGRPSFIHIEVGRDGAAFTRIAVGGQCVPVGEGVIRV